MPAKDTTFDQFPTTSGSGTGLELRVFVNWDDDYNWNASWSIIHKGDGYKVGEKITITRPFGVFPDSKIFPDGAEITITSIKSNNEADVNSEDNPYGGDTDLRKGNLNHYDAVADYVQFPGMETKSHQDGPEHEIVYVNEQVDPDGSAAGYGELAIGGIRINSSKEWTNFTQLSAYFKKGIKVADLVNSPAGPPRASSNFVEIAHALLTDENLGAGKLIGVNAIGDMTSGALFCQANNFTWDGVISNKINLREFLYQHGLYNLLDFTVIGGKFNLVPSVPVDSNNKIGYDEVIKPKVLFSDGNIKDLQVSFLSPEERQLFKANVLYREEKENGFAETKNCMVRLIEEQGGSETDPIETYDLSGFCTSRTHAKSYAYYILKLRKEVDHGLSFKTTPQYCVGLSPGDYFRLVSEATHVDRYRNGVITADGKVVSNETITGSQTIYYWKPNSTEVEEATVNFDGDLSVTGVVFAIKDVVTTNRVYKAETISYSEDGLIEVSGSHAPLTSAGTLAILDGWRKTYPKNHFIEII